MILVASLQVSAKDPKADIISVFKETYKNAVITSTHNKGFNMWIYAMDGNVKTVLKYNRRGQVVESFRYFKDEHLTPMQALKLKNEYSHMKLHSVTEWMNGKSTIYRIVLVDDKKWMHIDSDNNANFKIVKDFEKG
jgi:hypothetical protein